MNATGEDEDFAVGAEGANVCPEGFKGIGDIGTCKKAQKALGLGPWGRKDSWHDFPMGCFRRPAGDVYMNNNAGNGRELNAPICQMDFELNVKGMFETRDA